MTSDARESGGVSRKPLFEVHVDLNERIIAWSLTGQILSSGRVSSEIAGGNA